MSPAVQAQLRDAKRRYRGEGCRLAAMILLAEPEAIGEMLILDFLRQIEYVKTWRAKAWLANAKITDLAAAASDLDRPARGRLAWVLTEYWKASQS